MPDEAEGNTPSAPVSTDELNAEAAAAVPATGGADPDTGDGRGDRSAGDGEGGGADGSSGGAGGGTGRSAAPANPPRKQHRTRNILLSATAVLVVCALGLSSYIYYEVHSITRNLKHTTLLPPGVTQPPEQADAFGDSPLNILLIGSDDRNTAADAQLGGDAGSGARGDSEMVLHLSADRSNATVLSIPRDTVTQLPQCAGGGVGMINSALAQGPDCQVAAVHELTGLTIDHYVMFDFSGVVDISQEVGGVPVCVSAAIRDPNSGLTLPAGSTNVEGVQALQFLRTRDAFYDGSDIGRERATHYFFSQLIQKLKANASLTNLVQLQSLAETFSRFTTVDDGLDGISPLINLAGDLNKVPTDRITFLIVPWNSDPADPNRVVPDSTAAPKVFAQIKADKSFTAGPPGRAGSPAAEPNAGSSAATPDGMAPGTLEASEDAAAEAHPMKVAVVNASGTTGRSATIVQELFNDGFVYANGLTATHTTPATTLIYEPSETGAAQELAATLGFPASALKATGTASEITLVIGTDWPIGNTFFAATGGSSPTNTLTLPPNAYVQNASQSDFCIAANPAFETH